jgi:hypothetical protein
VGRPDLRRLWLHRRNSLSAAGSSGFWLGTWDKQAPPGAPRGANIFLMVRPYSEAGSPHAPAYVDEPSPFWDRRPTLSWRLLHQWARDLHVRRRHVCSRDLHSLECGAAGGRAAVPSPRRRVLGRPGHLRGRRGRALDPAVARPDDVRGAWIAGHRKEPRRAPRSPRGLRAAGPLRPVPSVVDWCY